MSNMQIQIVYVRLLKSFPEHGLYTRDYYEGVYDPRDLSMCVGTVSGMFMKLKKDEYVVLTRT
jgi:hypothetical protein